MFMNTLPRPSLYRSTNTVTQSTGRVEAKFQKSLGCPTAKGRRAPGVHPPGARRPSACGEWVLRGASAFVSLALPVLGLDRRHVDGGRDRSRGSSLLLIGPLRLSAAFSARALKPNGFSVRLAKQ